MEILQKNLEVIEKRSKEIYKAIIDKLELENEEKELDIESLETRDKNLALTVKKDGKLYRFNSGYSPIKEASVWAEQFEMKGIRIVISMIGLGNGYFVRELIKKLENGASILVYEPSMEIFIHVLKNYDISDILSENHFMFVLKGINDNKIMDVYNRLINWLNFANQKFCVHPKYDEVFAEECNRFLKMFREAAERAQIERNTEFHFANVTLDNFLYNLKHMKDSHILSQYKNTFPEDVPAIIVSAGPSLDKNIEKLKLAKGKAVIVGVDTALKYMYPHDIEPDFGITIDAQKRTEYFNDSRSLEVPLICKFESRSEILDAHAGKKIFYGSEEYMDGLYKSVDKETMPVYSAGGSVATCAFSVLRDLGFKRIILVGQDLAYKGDASHAGGDIYNIGEEETGIQMVEGIDGSMVKVRYDWMFYLRWFENAIAVNSDIEVVDATEGGAKIAGSKIMTLEEAINEYCKTEIDCNKIVGSKPNALNEEELEKVKKYIESLAVDLDIIKRKAEKTVGNCDKLLKYCKNRKKEDSNYFKLAKEIEKANTFIEKKSIYKMVDLCLSDKVMEDMLDIFSVNEDEFEDKAKTFSNTKMVYKEIIDATNVLRERLKQTVDKI